MQGSILTRLIVVTVVALVLALWVSGRREGAAGAPEVAGQALYPGFTEALNDVTALEVRGAEHRFTVERAGDDWRLAEWGGFPVRFEAVKKALVGLADLELVEEKTSRPDLYEKLGVQGADAEGNNPGLYLISPEAGPVVRLTQDESDRAPAWSPTCRRQVRKLSSPWRGGRRPCITGCPITASGWIFRRPISPR